MKIKKGDTVLMIKGKDRVKVGHVVKVIPKEQKLVVEGLNLVKKHQRPRRQGEKGQIITIPRAISIANVKLICPKCGKATRVGYTLREDQKQRMCKKCGVNIN